MHPPAPFAETDPLFVARFRARIPPDVAASFTPEQLAAIHTAFALRTLPRHSLDLRRSLPTPWGRMYLAIIAGREKRGQARRQAERARRRAGAVGDFALLGALSCLVVVIGAGGLYLAKMALGIDLVPGVDMLPDKAMLQALLD
ncbi:hypothetical protein [Elioraea sp.]|uniref:hypothetical protein n=1 Tax=Elioraea sp. TaxID=2185103 RepID=UPI0025C607A1|nr:hypothetical protein [Elioraea sp.]